MTELAWHWIEGRVDRSHEHIVLLFGDANTQSAEDWVPVALVSPLTGTVFQVQFLIDQRADDSREPVAAVRRELNFYLVEKRERDPWSYAKYHCGTAANLYSRVHWCLYSGSSRAEPSSAADPARDVGSPDS